MLVLQIDAENIPWKYAPVLDNLLHTIGKWSAGGIYGKENALGAWSPFRQSWHLSFRHHTGGKNAADILLCEDAWKFYQQGARKFIVVSNDGDYASLANALTCAQCQVFGIGLPHASRKFRVACSKFYVMHKGEPLIAEGCTEMSSYQEDTFGSTINYGTTLVEESPRSDKRTKALTNLYGSPQMPSYLFQCFGHFLQQCFHALSLVEEEHTLLLVAEPAGYITLLEQLVADPLVGPLFQAERKTQWERIITFARTCEQAYQQGRTDAEKSFGQLFIEAESPLFLGRLEEDRQQTSYREPLARAHTYYVDRPQNPAISSLRQWYTRGYLARGRELQAKAQAIWTIEVS